ncbi:ATP-binding SpoIIE family protein phosphatase [Reinekea marinisedimentorum]|uniref:Histidine kinase-like protein n=1 Tax=Reinekea marinisedimentorum TaxID=230495 RepID=A0A4R3IAB2_9GAMM|nr:fused response regulator/phosphatase [Reinekea marinisedimentorum]TCS42419.1 histidine kinase-like protein [Reinekea marinisedimentorum]
MAGNEFNSLRILIADDNESDRIILKGIVTKEGHEVVQAKDGEEALKQYRDTRPDLILLDVIMPGLNGIEVAKEVRRTSLADEYVPIIFLTSLVDPKALAECLESGGDDFLSKPYSRTILKAKIKAFGRMRNMQEKLRDHNRQMLIEQQVAKTIFDNVAHAGCLGMSNISYSLSPLSVFNGDTVLAERKPDGGMHLFLGDFTGHGLPAAIGAMPLAEIFYGMTAKGFSTEEVLREMNSKLNDILPTGVFCCGCFIAMDFYENIATIWVGGLPDVVCFRAEERSIDILPSENLPLGILSAEQFSPKFTELRMSAEDELFVWSDGIIEARNSENEFFGEDRLFECFTHEVQGSMFQRILNSVEEFVGQAGAEDDITLLSVKMADIDEIGLPDFNSKRGSLGGPLDWSFSYTLRHLSLKEFNPLPVVLSIITEVEGLRSLSGQLYTLIAELYSNALEHGVLNLSSSLKASPEGFEKYYLERESRLDSMTDGSVTIHVHHEPLGTGGRLTLTIDDSGKGFDHKKVTEAARSDADYCGRGIPLVKGISKDIHYNESGNSVTAYLEWPQEK